MAFYAYLDVLGLREQLERQLFRVRRRNVRDTSNPFELPEQQFRLLFRLTKPLALELCHQLEGGLQRQTRGGLPVHVQVLTTVRFYAEGGYQRGVGQDLFGSISQPSGSRCIQRVTREICVLKDRWIQFPVTAAERRNEDLKFQQQIGFPGVIGAIDCTHVNIVTPKVHEEAYVNHHGFHSVNVQMVCTTDLRVMNVNPYYAGSVNDQFIWQSSVIRDEMRRLSEERIGNFYLIGDSGYTPEPWLLTPITHAAEGIPESRYTRAHCRARNCIERCFGVLKARWRCLRQDRALHYEHTEAVSIIQACVVLHNMMLHHGIVEGEDIRQALAIRERIVRQYFV